MSQRSLRILIVDDEGVVRSLLARAFEEADFEVAVEATAEQALLRCLDPGAPPDLLVTDLSMPGMSGIDLIKRVRRQAPRVGVLAVSGFEDLLLRASDEGIPTVRKPCTMSDVVSAAMELLPADDRSSGAPPKAKPSA